MTETKRRRKKETVEEPLIDQSGESIKKLISKGKKQGFLLRNDCENARENEKYEDKDEFYSKVESLNIQIFENENDDAAEEEDQEAHKNITEKDEDTGRTDDPVRMYLKEMGNVELLSRIGEIEIAKRIENPIIGIILMKTAKAVDEIAIRFSIATQKMVMGAIIIRNAYNL